MRGPLCRLVVGQLQQQLHQLAAIVKEKKAGLKNTLRSWLGGSRKGGDAAAASPPGGADRSGGASPRYQSSAIESHMRQARLTYLPCPSLTLPTLSCLRQLADFAFLLHDFGTALTHYRAAGVEFKGDKAWRHYAGTQEMAALCLALTGGSRREFDDAIEKACGRSPNRCMARRNDATH